ncbi:M56 family metallopeptidase [Tahibacter soli]|uniref:M56 family metallopeptidase n=1 Tax=Tahibacter soli TaxID=2983605 RepID=A0A9X3YM07_9GAMM|nr:M56 family metallopeptidase [Tahibacter soli]MDC8014722.1 M56 family metallopeptidase [Tahibacter soli]
MSAEALPPLVAATLAATVALLVVLPARSLLRSAFGAGAAYAAWLAVPLALVAAFVPVPRDAALVVLPAGASPRAAVAAVVAPIAPSGPVASLVVATWFAGFAVSLALTLRRQRRFDTALAARRLVVRAAAGPLVTGMIVPRIVLPADFRLRYTARERRLIVAHEGAHARRGDVRANALAALVRCAFWFHPLVHVAHARFRLDQELACDAAVIARFPEARRCYAGAMLKTQLAGDAPTDRRAPLGCAWRIHHPIEERIQMLKHPVPGRARRALGIASAALVAVGAAFGAWAGKPETRHYVDAKLAVRIDDGGPQDVRLIGPLGDPLEVRIGEGAQAWRLTFVATDEAPGRLRMAGDVRLADATIGKPQIVVADGVAGQIVMTTADGRRKIDIAVNLTRTDRPTPDDEAG